VGDNSSEEEVVIGAPTFAEGVDNRGAPIRPAASFANVRQIFSIFAAQGLRNGVLLTTIWYLDGKEVLRDESPWSSGDVSIGWQSIQHSEGLPVGRYRLEMVAEGRPVVSGEFDITASDTLAADRTVNVTGRVVSADNRDRTISGATVYFLNPGISAKDWLRRGMSAADVHASGVSGVGGAYQLNQRIPAGKQYGLVVLHGDYRTLLEENYSVAGDAVDPYLLDLPMQRQ
jgi:hypothetical protein